MIQTRMIQAMRIAQVIQPLARRWRSAVDREMAEYGLSDATGWVLLMAGRLGDGVRQADIAASLNVGGASLVRLIDQLEAAGLVERRVDEGDRRANGLYVSDTGRTLLTELEARLADMRAGLFEGVSDEDLATTVRVIDHLDGVLAVREQEK